MPLKKDYKYYKENNLESELQQIEEFLRKNEIAILVV